MSELLARLNPKTARFDIGSGSIHSLTDQDIAAAQGMVKNILGRDANEYLQCMDEKQRLKFEGRCLGLMYVVYQKSMNDSLAYHLQVQDRPTFVGRVVKFISQPFRERRDSPALAWPPFEPRNAGMYARLVMTVLAEIQAGPSCKACGGGESVAPPGAGTCHVCNGHGRIQNPQRLRAAAMRIPLAQFQRKWEAPYKWLYSELLTAMDDATRQLRRAAA